MSRVLAVFWTAWAAWNGFMLFHSVDAHNGYWIVYTVILVVCIVMNGWVNYSSIFNQGRTAAYKELSHR